ncbi:hypothetical protein [Allorhodopirellula solitaria]|nr:hypothetical protein [Allorhodopirellula solitaria]
MILASIEKKPVRDKLFARSLEEGWGSTRLRKELKDLKGLPVTRPLHTAYSIQKRAQALADAIKAVDEESLSQAVGGMKPADRSAAIDSYQKAYDLLGDIAYDASDKCSAFMGIIEKLKQSEDEGQDGAE